MRLDGRAALAFVLALACWGCNSYSINPWITPEARIRDDRLLGTWKERGAMLVIGKSEDSTAYRFSYLSTNGASMSGKASLGRIGGKLFVDYEPGAGSNCPGICANHSFYQVQLSKQTLVLNYLKAGNMEELVRAAMCDEDDTTGWKGAIFSQEKGESPLILTSASDELESLLDSCASKPDAWLKVESFTR